MDKKIREEYFKILKSDISTLLSELKTVSNKNNTSPILREVSNRIGTVKNSLNSALAGIQKNEDWDNLVIAFFGETNAGKSTIIESMRIFFDDENQLRHTPKKRTLFERIFLFLKKNQKTGDGRIIGTGESDFTKTFTSYDFKHKDKNFKLIDMPGIEGNEKKFVNTIKSAIAKSHILFFIIGTNKPIEQGTLKKIQEYIPPKTLIVPLYNVKGLADSYEFEEDRIALENTHKDINKVINPVKDALKKISTNIADAIAVHGLLSFCALAQSSGYTTIVSDRTSLIKQQADFHSAFSNDYDKMYKFSNFHKIENIIKQKTESFIDEIKYANTQKVLNVLLESKLILILSEKEINKEKDSIKNIVFSAMRRIQNKGKNVKERFIDNLECIIDKKFSELKDKLHEIIEKYVDEKDILTSELDKAVKEETPIINSSLQKTCKNQQTEEKQTLKTILKNMTTDIKHLKTFSQTHEERRINLDIKLKPISIDISIKSVAAKAFNMASLAASGALAGGGLTGGNPIGFAVGGAIGFLLGLGFTIWGWIRGEAYRIQKAKEKINKQLDSAKRQLLSDLALQLEDVYMAFEKMYNEAYIVLEKELVQFDKSSELIHNMINEFTKYIKKEEKTHGTI